MGLPALDEIRNALLEYLDFFFFFFWSWAGQQNANEFSEISPGTYVTMPSFVGRRWQVTSPNFSLWHNFPCRNFRCHRPQLFSNKKWKTSLSFYLLQFLFFYFRHSVLQLYTCHLFIYMNSVNINLHKISRIIEKSITTQHPCAKVTMHLTRYSHTGTLSQCASIFAVW